MCIAFLAHGVHIAQNPLLSYLFTQILFILNNFSLFIIGFVILALLSLRTFRFDSRNPLHHHISTSVFQIFSALIVGLFLAFALMLLIAWLELNSTAVLININPTLVGLVSDKKTIIQTLKTNPAPPTVAPSDQDASKEVVAVASVITGNTSLYGDTFLSSIPSFLILPIRKHPLSMLLVDNTLIITKLDAPDFQTISPIVGYSLVQHYFPLRRIKSNPTIRIMQNNQYIAFRQKDAGAKLGKVDESLGKIDQQISSISASITQDNSKITLKQQQALTASNKIETQYNTCMDKGAYRDGVFYHANDVADCKSILDTLDTASTSSDTAIAGIQKKLQDDKDHLANYNYYKEVFAQQKSILAVATDNIPSELGVFEPDDTIKIDLQTSNPHAVVDYYETLTHEYLHFASYVKGKKFDSSFFEEGLTEYFARQVIQDGLNIDTNIAYPVQVKIISEITKSIAESDLTDIYFTKDETRLETTLDRVYGDGFYKNNFILFESLQYASDPTQVLMLANTIMKKIGGSPLTEKDLYSTNTNL